MSIISAKDLCLWYGNFQALKNINIEIVDELSETERGDGGFGSTGE